jgi:serine/threonine-protein kinase RsbW
VDSTPRDAVNSSPTSARTAADVVQLRLPAAGAYLSVLRTATAGLAARLHFTLEEIEDLRIAVDEACAMLLASAVPGADLECTFVLSPDLVKVSVTVLTLDGAEPSRDTFSWTVLTALAGEVTSRVDDGHRVTIELHKHRETYPDPIPPTAAPPATGAAASKPAATPVKVDAATAGTAGTLGST